MGLLKLKRSTITKIRKVLFIIVCILIYSWATVSCIEMWLNCAIIDVNTSNVEDDLAVGGFTEVSEVELNGDFYLEDDSTKHTSRDINEYIRVSNDMKYYYNSENKVFVAPLTLVESRNVVLKFFILDIITYIILITVWVFCINAKLSKVKRIVDLIMLFIVIVVSFCMSQFAYIFASEVLFNVVDYVWLILTIKSVGLMIATVVCVLIEKHKHLKIKF